MLSAEEAPVCRKTRRTKAGAFFCNVVLMVKSDRVEPCTMCLCSLRVHVCGESRRDIWHRRNTSKGKN